MRTPAGLTPFPLVAEGQDVGEPDSGRTHDS